MSALDDDSSRFLTVILSLYKNKIALSAIVISSVLLAGCYAFVDDKTAPEWNGPENAQQANAANAAGSGGPGAAVFNRICATCHQMNGKGIPGVYPPLAGSAIATGDPRLPLRIILHGFHGPIERGGKRYNGVMQPWRNELSDQEIADVLSYVRTSFGNSASKVSADTVRKVRDETKSKSGPYTEEELKASVQ